MWAVRKLYGNMPPTDPRFLALTNEQIDLDMMHVMLDQQLRDGTTEVYSDETFDEFDKETDEIDNKFTDIPTADDFRIGLSATEVNEDDWEEVD